MSKVKKAIIPAAGLGTRFLPVTKAIPKEMLPIVDKPTLQYIVEELVGSDITEILIITGHNKKSIEDHFDTAYELEELLKRTKKFDYLKVVDDISYMANIHYTRQREAKGLGHAILCGKYFIGDEPFAVLLGDDVVYTSGSQKPCIKQLVDVFDQTGKTVLGVQKVAHNEVSKYGVIDPASCNGRVYTVQGLVEKPNPKDSPSDVAVLGRYVITPDIFSYLEHQEPGKGGEIQLTDSLAKLIPSGVYAYEFEGRRYDIGDKNGYLQATVEYALRDENLSEEFGAYLKRIASTL